LQVFEFARYRLFCYCKEHIIMEKNTRKSIISEYKKRFPKKKFIPGETPVPVSGKVFDEKEILNMTEAVLEGHWTDGKYVQEFENKLAGFVGRKFCATVNSGSSANLAALSALTSVKLPKEMRLKAGDEVITVAAGFPTTVNPIIKNNLTPVFVDVDMGTYDTNVKELKKALGKKTKAIFIAHTLGNPFNIDEIVKLCQKHNLWLIEDNCIEGNRCSVVKVDDDIQVLTIKEIYDIFHNGKYKSFEIISHDSIFKDEDLRAPSLELKNMLSKRQINIIEKYKKYGGNTKKIVNALGVSTSSYYSSMWEIRKKMREFVGTSYKWSKVTNVIFKGRKDVFKITQNFGQTCVTADHKLMVIKGNILKEKFAKDFVRDNNEFINILLTDNAKKDEVDLAKYLGKHSQENGKIHYDDDWIWFEYNKNCWKGKMIDLPKIKRKYNGRDLEKLCALFGLYCSEGSCGRELRFAFGDYTRVELVEKYIKSISNLKHVRISMDDSRGKTRIIRGKSFRSRKVIYLANMGHELMNILFSKLGGTDSYDKRVPNFIFNLDEKYMKTFYDHYIYGDGCRKSEDAIDFVITTASEKMAAGINLLNNLILKKFSRIIIAKNRYYDISPVKSLKYVKRKINKIEKFKNADVYDITVDNASTFVDACGNVLLHNCDALGSKYDGKYTGTFGHISTLSFYPAHHITTAEGGAVFTDTPILNKVIKSIRDWGRDCWCATGKDNTCGKRFEWKLGDLPYGYDHKYIYSEIGYNLKMTDIQAALGLAQLDKLPEFIKKRKENFDYLYQAFQKFEKYFILPEWEKKAEPDWFGFLLTVKKSAKFSREDLTRFLNERKIGTRLLFAGNIIRQPYFINYGVKYRTVGALKNTDLVMNNTFWIGVYPGLNREMLNYTVKCFEEFLKRYH